MKKLTAVMVMAVLTICSFSAFGLTSDEMNQIVNAQVHKVAGVNIYIVDAQAYANNDWRTVDYLLSGIVADGVAFFPPTVIKAKSYVALSYFFGSGGGETLFRGVTPFTVVAGQTCQLHIRPEMEELFHYRFSMNDLPINLDPQTSQVRISIGDQLYGGNVEMADNGKPVINLYAPYDIPAGTEMTLSDANHSIAVQVSLNPLDVIAGNLNVLYVPSTTSTSLEVTVEFVARQPVHINSVGYTTIDDALAATTGDVTIELGEGQFDPFVVIYGRKAIVQGQGVGKTMILIKADRNGGLNYLREGQWDGSVELHNLAVENNGQYSAISASYESIITMTNCAVTSLNAPCISTYIGSKAIIDHCILVGPSAGSPLYAGYGSDQIRIANSIIMEAKAALRWDLSANWDSQNNMVGVGISASNCCFHHCLNLVQIDVAQPDLTRYTLDYFQSIDENPQLEWNWHLSSESCLNRNIGIDWNAGLGKGK